MKFKNEYSQQVFRNLIETYVSQNFDTVDITKMLVIVIADYVACNSLEETIDLLTELEDSALFLNSEGL